MKRCKDCGLELPLSEFSHSTRSKKSYPTSYCRQCAATRAKRWREQNTERVKLTKQLYALKNPTLMSAAKRRQRLRRKIKEQQ